MERERNSRAMLSEVGVTSWPRSFERDEYFDAFWRGGKDEVTMLAHQKYPVKTERVTVYCRPETLRVELLTMKFPAQEGAGYGWAIQTDAIGETPRFVTAFCPRSLPGIDREVWAEFELGGPCVVIHSESYHEVMQDFLYSRPAKITVYIRASTEDLQAAWVQMEAIRAEERCEAEIRAQHVHRLVAIGFSATAAAKIVEVASSGLPRGV